MRDSPHLAYTRAQAVLADDSMDGEVIDLRRQRVLERTQLAAAEPMNRLQNKRLLIIGNDPAPVQLRALIRAAHQVVFDRDAAQRSFLRDLLYRPACLEQLQRSRMAGPSISGTPASAARHEMPGHASVRNRLGSDPSS